ncbi:hypothetical protein [Streptomyces yangpuensis]
MTWLGFGIALWMAGGLPEHMRRRPGVPDASIENALAQQRSRNLG